MTKKEQAILDYKAKFYATVNRMKTRKAGFTIDDVVGKIGNPPQGRHALAGLMTSASRGLTLKGYVLSDTPSRRGGSVAVWAAK